MYLWRRSYIVTFKTYCIGKYVTTYQILSILSTRGNSIEHHLSYLAEAYSESIHPNHPERIGLLHVSRHKV
ncbi:hypothetical protein ACN42_g3185 [Penicillium freii]|uniref:Uncharacterized protein n=1 Tax=Penicillium freii TaxID=48697 RepID=A0A124GSB4_PENFR|nr:hypothetical protein ACN42_g3185 [Penicillium freii]